MTDNLIERLSEEWANLDPVDPLRGLIRDAIAALSEARAAIEHHNVPAGWYITKAEAVADAEEQAMLAAAPQPQPDRCKYCDGTGDVHSITGEWRGSCGCEDGKAQPQPVQQEPVARVKFSDDAFDSVDWIPYQGQPLKDGDLLFTSPQAQAAHGITKGTT